MPDIERYAALARIVRARGQALIDEAHEAEHIDAGQRDDGELLLVLARLLGGKSPYAAFGAPGDWGYGTPIGDALAAAYKMEAR